jgi:hypothetical protein
VYDAKPHAREEQYLSSSSFVETWKYPRRDLVVDCRYYEKRDHSLPFFTKLGYRTLAGAYHDVDDLTNPKA